MLLAIYKKNGAGTKYSAGPIFRMKTKLYFVRFLFPNESEMLRVPAEL